MSEKPTNPADINPEELLKQVEAAVAFVEKNAALGRKQFAYTIKLAEDRLAYAEAQLTELTGMRDRLEEAYARSQAPAVDESPEEDVEATAEAAEPTEGEDGDEAELAPEAVAVEPVADAPADDVALEEATAIVPEALASDEPEAEPLPVIEADVYEAEMARIKALMMVFATTRRMMTIEIACHKHNLAQMDFNPKRPPAELQLRNPALDANHMEARAYLDVNLAVLLVTDYLDGADVVLRATGGQPAVAPKSDEELAARQALADGLKSAMAKDPGLLILANQIGNELQETLALLEWGQGALSRLDTVLPEARRSILEDEDWARLNGRVSYLQGVAERAVPYPILAEIFPLPEGAALPYEPVQWEPTLAASTAPVGTGRLTLSQLAQQQGTGRLSGTGRLPSPEKPGTGRLL